MEESRVGDQGEMVIRVAQGARGKEKLYKEYNDKGKEHEEGEGIGEGYYSEGLALTEPKEILYALTYTGNGGGD
ncbi:UNVERIFIED_CONTAM: hypothetical protein FKN15_071599 [Acipenser sinensis]